ncbi:DNA polymerase III subunit delta [Leuconostoc falkenbergense]|jgi:DNA polymerase-3 subunit delta|uniref:DNA polymerase III subunit delta n=2 Tax=Leuconostoc falkenbergense TaxID=2766470 RepID=A0A9X3EAP4_9LACO|nr:MULTISPECIES: DNA polymerase III subunit delta [Leuconostoc]RDG18942.1 DNA polymerase III subunit delta [Leuconostoc pseudomesenteroides]MCT4377583.1 DNA polymerase III subunit delta [Leuconostoc falkenbergense]MCT4389821.1 DNA polymerase III subunit delta [Leuconostoc falkenbergense]MCT4410167.1 DNA polymerase III subunit delta [Leuconostoc falkenbergense]MCX7579567.1 DNA polymerase III subunit delta [Leuconostoc falkenbergense]
MNFKQLQQQIDNNAMANFYVVTGEEEILLRRTAFAFKQLVVPEDRDMNYSQFDLSDQPLDMVINDAMSAPFFGERRVIIVSKPLFLTATGKISDHDSDLLLQLLEKPLSENIVVFFANNIKLDKRKKITKSLLKTSELVELPVLDERQSKQAVVAELTQRDYQIMPDALNELVMRTNAHYSDMQNELPKLIAYANKTKKIDLQAVSSLVPNTLTATAFTLVEAVIKNQQKAAVTIYRELLQNNEIPLRINAVLIGQFRLLLQVAGLSGNEATIASQLKVHPYRVKLAKQILKNHQLTNIRSGYLGMLNMERLLKSTQQDPEILFERFVLN